jgi:dTDP-4-amino-4,6-dideoxy-D-galactose acyltransferase
VNSEPCELLPWDTEFFGFPIARLKLRTLSPQTWENAERWCESRGIRCLYCPLVPDFASTRIAEAHGANLIDIKMTYTCSLAGRRMSAMATTGRIREATAADLPALEAIAGSSHHGRFLNDGRFPPAKCRELYRVWIRKSVTQSEDHVLVIEADDGLPRGYCGCKRVREDGSNIGVIDIIAVDERARGQGFGTALVDAALSWFAAHGMSTARLITQAQNLVSQRVYQRCGFIVSECQLVYHRWFDPTEPGAGRA